MIDRTRDLPLARQAALLRLSRSSLYYEPQPVPQAELAIMRRIDALHLDYPFAAAGCCVTCCAARASSSAVRGCGQ
jgi:putative transposase